MSPEIEKPKRKPKDNSLFSTLLDLIASSTSFEFEVDEPLDTCIARLKQKERTGFFCTFFTGSTWIKVTPRHAGTCHFYVRRHVGRGTDLFSRGSMKSISERSTLISGAAGHSSVIGPLTIVALGALFWLVALPQIWRILTLQVGLNLFCTIRDNVGCQSLVLQPCQTQDDQFPSECVA